MVSFIDDHRESYGVEPICEVLPIAPSTYYAHKAFQSDPSLRSPRAQRDKWLQKEIRRVWKENRELYGAEKVWKQLNREGIRVAWCTVRRLMKEMGLEGAVRGNAFKTTTIPGEEASRLPDLVDRDFQVRRPNELWVSDLTYVATWRGFVYVAFVIDAFARRIVGWRVSTSLRSDLALDALEQAIAEREDDQEGVAGDSHAPAIPRGLRFRRFRRQLGALAADAASETTPITHASEIQSCGFGT